MYPPTIYSVFRTNTKYQFCLMAQDKFKLRLDYFKIK